VPGRWEMPIFGIPSIPPWKAVVLLALVVLIMVFFPPLLTSVMFGVLIVYIFFRLVTG
jgi:hypothetical protein